MAPRPPFDFITKPLYKALYFDIRKGAHSIGSSVRDAAAYIIWSLARAQAPTALEPYANNLARRLVAVSLFDREIHIRRASSAAFQEHVGRTVREPPSGGHDRVLIVVPPGATEGSIPSWHRRPAQDGLLRCRDPQECISGRRPTSGRVRPPRACMPWVYTLNPWRSSGTRSTEGSLSITSWKLPSVTGTLPCGNWARSRSVRYANWSCLR